MNVNVPTPYGETCSPPQNPIFAFYSPQADDLLFERARIGRAPIEILCQAGLHSVSLSWTLHRNAIDKPFRQGMAEALPANRFRISIDPANLPPGFYDLRVTLDPGVPPDMVAQTHSLKGVCVFGWRASEMPVRETRPADFVQFWSNARAKLAAIPLDARDETPMQAFGPDEIGEYNLKHAALPPDYDPTGHKAAQVESCKVSFAGPDGGRVFGWLAKPRTAGPFPAMLIVPGAGIGQRPRPLEHARHGYLALDIQVHGLDVDLPSYPTIPGYYSDFQFQPPESYYYYNVYLRVVRALDYLASRPDVDKKRIVVVGGSQGGRLSVVAAGLDSRVAAIVSCIANSPNYPYLAWAAKCNGVYLPWDNMGTKTRRSTAQSDGMDAPGAPPLPDNAAGACIAYYDPMNFAPDIKCPVMMNCGLIDPVSPPYSVFAVYDRLRTRNKTMVALPGLAHDWSAEFDRRAWRWLDSVLDQSGR